MIAAGAQVGSYRVLSLLGEGGMGQVYLVDAGGKRAALKALRPELCRQREVVGRFLTEARVAHIDHPHIVEISDFGETTDGQPYYVMELLQGESVAARLKRRGRLPPHEVVHIGAQVCSALAAAHDSGILHRDLKTENLYLIERDGDPLFVKVLDFGVAKLLDATLKARTQAGVAMGTPSYMSPEQAQGLADVDARSDVYSLGVVLFEMATGRLPFEASTPLAVLMLHLNQERPSLAELAPDLPPALRSTIDRAIARERGERWSSMAEMRQALMAMPLEAGAGRSRGKVTPPWLYAAAALAALLVISGAAYAVHRSGRRSVPAEPVSPAAVATSGGAPAAAAPAVTHPPPPSVAAPPAPTLRRKVALPPARHGHRRSSRR